MGVPVRRTEKLFSRVCIQQFVRESDGLHTGKLCQRFINSIENLDEVMVRVQNSSETKQFRGFIGAKHNCDRTGATFLEVHSDSLDNDVQKEDYSRNHVQNRITAKEEEELPHVPPAFVEYIMVHLVGVKKNHGSRQIKKMV